MTIEKTKKNWKKIGSTRSKQTSNEMRMNVTKDMQRVGVQVIQILQVLVERS
jgi:hypothetical protein